MNYKRRILALRKQMAEEGLDSFLVTNEKNVSYLTGFQGEDLALLFTKDKDYFITDSRYVEDAESSVKGFEIMLVELSNYETLKALVGASRARAMGFESMNLPYEVAAKLKTVLRGVKIAPYRSLVEILRAVKDPDEIAAIRSAIRCTKNVLKKTLAILRPGLTERFLAKQIESKSLECGGRAAFDPIVAFGKNSSKPHARATDTKIGKVGHLMIDMGYRLNGYNSDYTRIVFLGRVKDRIKKIYDIVHNAQDAAFKMIRPGRKISEIDLAARRHIQDAGFGKYFGHSLGHGVGMEVHEKPSISKINNNILKPGMVFTIEPAIYIPKFGGVRIEDMVLVTANGFEILTR